MSKFSNIQFDKNGNVSNVSFPKSNLSVEIKYSDPIETEDEYVPSKAMNVVIDGHALSVDQFKEVKVDEEGTISVGGSGGSGKPWWMWWDWIGGLIPHTESDNNETQEQEEVGDINDTSGN